MNSLRIASITAAVVIGGLAALLAGFIAAGGLAGASEAPAPVAAPSPELRDQWGNLPPAEQAALKAKMQRFMQLPPEQRERMKQRYERFQKLTPDGRQALRERWQLFRSMPPETREQMLRKHQHLQEMSPERRRAFAKKMQRTFREMPDRELAEFIHNLNAWRMLPPEDKDQAFRRYIDFRKPRHAPEDAEKR